MPYCTLQQLIDRAGEAMMIALTDRADVPENAIDPVIVARAQADADAMIDGYLAGRYALPLNTTPGLLADIAQAITLWKLHGTEPEAKILRDYDDAIKRLKDIAMGTIMLPDVAGIEPAAKGSNGVQINDRDRPFTPENMTGFI